MTTSTKPEDVFITNTMELVKVGETELRESWSTQRPREVRVVLDLPSNYVGVLAESVGDDMFVCSALEVKAYFLN